MGMHGDLVSIALPVFNGAAQLESVGRSVLTQDHQRIELVICDNASTDGTDEIGRALADADSRVVYHRQPENVGLLNNFVSAMRLARGRYLRWIGDDDWIAPDYVTRCLDQFRADSRLILVSTLMAYTGEDGVARTGSPQRDVLASDDPVERFIEVIRLLTVGYLHVDPLYALIRRDVLLGIDRRNMLREDEVFGAKLALAGPWGQVPEVLAHRHWVNHTRAANARLLGVPVWQNGFSSIMQSREIVKWLGQVELTPEQRRRAKAAVAELYVRRKKCALERARRKAAGLTVERVRASL